MYYHKIDKCSISNGLGIRTVLWVSGCSHCCRNCHNPQTWIGDSGKLFDDQAKTELFFNLEKPYVHGITFSGGDPLYPANRQEIQALSSEIKNKFPTKNQWLYTGYTWEEIIKDNMMLNVVQNVDIVVDGEYIDEQRDITLAFRGSRNQRVIDVKKTLEQNQIVLYLE